MGKACRAIAPRRPEFGAVCRQPKKPLEPMSCRRGKTCWMTGLAAAGSLFYADYQSLGFVDHPWDASNSVDAIASHHFKEFAIIAIVDMHANDHGAGRIERLLHHGDDLIGCFDHHAVCATGLSVFDVIYGTKIDAGRAAIF